MNGVDGLVRGRGRGVYWSLMEAPNEMSPSEYICKYYTNTLTRSFSDTRTKSINGTVPDSAGLVSVSLTERYTVRVLFNAQITVIVLCRRII